VPLETLLIDDEAALLARDLRGVDVDRQSKVAALVTTGGIAVVLVHLSRNLNIPEVGG
jgi:hypothetical protein